MRWICPGVISYENDVFSYFVLFVELYVSINEITAFFFALYSFTVILPLFALNKIFAGLYL